MYGILLDLCFVDVAALCSAVLAPRTTTTSPTETNASTAAAAVAAVRQTLAGQAPC